MAAVQSYRTLRVLLFAISVLAALSGLVLLFATSWVFSFSPGNIALFNNGLLIAMVKAMALIAIAFGYLLCAAAREPTRYIAVIDTLAFILLTASALNLYAALVLQLGSYIPEQYMIVRAIVQFGLGVAVIALRPKAAHAPGYSESGPA